LRVRFLPSDLNEIRFKDPITFNYFYEQTKNDFFYHKAPTLTNPDYVQILIELGCLEMRRTFQTMNQTMIDKKSNFEKDIGGLKRFFPDLIIQQKLKNIKKMISKNIKLIENYTESECMIKYLEQVSPLWPYNDEIFNCVLGSPWGSPITVQINRENAIQSYINGSKLPLKITTFDSIIEIRTELKNQFNGILKLRIQNEKEMLTFEFENLFNAENMASIIEDYTRHLTNKNLKTTSYASDSIALYRTTNTTKDESYTEIDPKLSSTLLNETSFPERAQSALDSLKGLKIVSDNYNFISISSASNDDSSLMLNESSSSTTDILLSLPSSSHIDSKLLVCFERLGSGQFGEVFRGIYNQKEPRKQIEVAIKRLTTTTNNAKLLKEEEIELKEEELIIIKKFISEAKVMLNFDHPHIIKLIGVSIDKPLNIVMELAKFGQLRSYLQTNRSNIELKTLLLYIHQLSTALAYLESKKFVHRDIAARNVLVSSHECIKLSDFGLSRQMDDNVYLASNRLKLPIKWMAPESINYRKFTHSSDVWMFGVCVWEILRYGEEKPFQNVKNCDVLLLIENNKRLSQSLNCPNEVYSLLLQCWRYKCCDRPTFNELEKSLK
jgi:focal adhesion kinase 1